MLHLKCKCDLVCGTRTTRQARHGGKEDPQNRQGVGGSGDGAVTVDNALCGGVGGHHATQDEEHERNVKDQENDGVPVVLEVELNHGLSHGFASAFKGGQPARVEAVIAFVTFQEVRACDVGASRVNLGSDHPRDEEVRKGHDDADHREKPDGKIGTWNGFKSRHWFTPAESADALRSSPPEAPP